MRAAILCEFVLIPLVLAQTTETEPNSACIDQAQIPTYPRLALFASVQGTVTAKVQLSPEAFIHQITSSGHRLLVNGAESAIRAARFHSDCAGRTITLVFEFEIAGTPPEQPKEKVFFSYPNHFRIVSEPQKGPVI